MNFFVEHLFELILSIALIIIGFVVNYRLKKLTANLDTFQKVLLSNEPARNEVNAHFTKRSLERKAEVWNKFVRLTRSFQSAQSNVKDLQELEVRIEDFRTEVLCIIPDLGVPYYEALVKPLETYLKIIEKLKLDLTSNKEIKEAEYDNLHKKFQKELTEYGYILEEDFPFKKKDLDIKNEVKNKYEEYFTSFLKMNS